MKDKTVVAIIGMIVVGIIIITGLVLGHNGTLIASGIGFITYLMGLVHGVKLTNKQKGEDNNGISEEQTEKY